MVSFTRILTCPLLCTQSQCQNSSGELGDVGDGGRVRYLQGKADTTILCVCTRIVGSAQCSGCVVYGSSATYDYHLSISIIIIIYY